DGEGMRSRWRNVEGREVGFAGDRGSYSATAIRIGFTVAVLADGRFLPLWDLAPGPGVLIRIRPRASIATATVAATVAAAVAISATTTVPAIVISSAFK
ncbi:MAG: hypothetical protein ACTHXF_00890, partial [Brevibacterium yomogidense]